jgi:hypothetical protein
VTTSAPGRAQNKPLAMTRIGSYCVCMALPYPATVLSHATGLSVGNGARLVTEMRAEKQLEAGRKFGGQDWELPHIRNFMVAASTGLSPKVAARATAGYIGSTYQGSPGASEQTPYLGLGTAGDVLNRAIEVGARHAAALDDGTIEELFLRRDPALRSVHYVDLWLNPLRIDFVWYSSNGAWARTDVYVPKSAPADDLPRGGVVTRKAGMPWALFVTAGRVWLETLRRRGAALPSTPSASTPASVGNENAEEPPASDTSAPTRTNDRSRTRETGQLANPDNKRVCENPQASADFRIGHFPCQ